MKIPTSAGSFKAVPPIVKIQRRVEIDEDGNEILETEEFWLIDGQGQTLEGKGPYRSVKEAAIAREVYLRVLGFEI